LTVILIRRRLNFPLLEPGPTLGNLAKLKEYERQASLDDCLKGAHANFDKSMMTTMENASSLRDVNPYDALVGFMNNMAYEDVNTAKEVTDVAMSSSVKAAGANVLTGVLLSKEVRAYYAMVAEIGPQYTKEQEDCEKRFGKH